MHTTGWYSHSELVNTVHETCAPITSGFFLGGGGGGTYGFYHVLRFLPQNVFSRASCPRSAHFTFIFASCSSFFFPSTTWIVTGGHLVRYPFVHQMVHICLVSDTLRRIQLWWLLLLGWGAPLLPVIHRAPRETELVGCCWPDALATPFLKMVSIRLFEAKRLKDGKPRLAWLSARSSCASLLPSYCHRCCVCWAGVWRKGLCVILLADFCFCTLVILFVADFCAPSRIIFSPHPSSRHGVFSTLNLTLQCHDIQNKDGSDVSGLESVPDLCAIGTQVLWRQGPS